MHILLLLLLLLLLSLYIKIIPKQYSWLHFFEKRKCVWNVEYYSNITEYWILFDIYYYGIELNWIVEIEIENSKSMWTYDR
jgi:hypothetical protein